jgi:prophage DNA circulation protein
MGWENSLLNASFRGVPLEVKSTSDDIERSTVVHEYPYVDGANVEDLGRRGRMISLVVIFYGDDYETQLQDLLNSIDLPGSAELIHPVFGSINAQFMRAHVPHSGDKPDQTEVQLDFMEDSVATPLFDRVLPVQKADKINTAADDALEAARSGFSIDIKNALNLPSLLRSKLSADMLSAISTMSTYTGQLIEARGWVASGAYYLDNPTAFADDMTSGMVSRVTALFSSFDISSSYFGNSVGASRGSLSSVWSAPLANLKQPFFDSVNTPIQPQATTVNPDLVQPFLVAQVQVQQTVAIAAAGAQVLGAAADTPVLTPSDIETIAGDARSSINDAIALIELIYPDIIRSRPMTEPLKDMALALTDMAETLIHAKPPLRDRTVDFDGNLHLIAHAWYGDYTRATELLRLNPKVRNPNFIECGTVLKAYMQ